MVSMEAVKQRVATAVRKADLNTVSTKQIRRTVEQQLKLEQDELTSGKWKTIVKSVIEETMAAIERGDPPPQDKAAQDERENEDAPKKIRRKKGVIQDAPTSSPVKQKVKSPTKSPTSPIPKSKKSVPKEASASPLKKKRKTIEDDQSDSEMSLLNDSTPPTTKPRKPTTKDPSRATKPTPKPSNTTKPVTSSSEEEIKHLKSLVFKCGVRKNWSKELPSSMSSSEQILHLKTVLHSLGMTGRFSVEKAKKIKEERELREELDFIQETAKNLGEGHRRRS